jgi:hypothetical protein
MDSKEVIKSLSKETILDLAALLETTTSKITLVIEAKMIAILTSLETIVITVVEMSVMTTIVVQLEMMKGV